MGLLNKAKNELQDQQVNHDELTGHSRPVDEDDLSKIEDFYVVESEPPESDLEIPSHLKEVWQGNHPSLHERYHTQEIDIADFYQKLSQETLLNLEYVPYSPKSCRFKDVQCPINTHVNVKGADQFNYLHANYVILDGQPFILSQYPLPSQEALFWESCREVCLVVDLTNPSDMRKGLNSYVPDLKGLKFFSSGNIRCQSELNVPDINAKIAHYQIMTLHDNEQQVNEISRLHYEGWPDHHGIKAEDLHRLIQIILAYRKQSDASILVHCRAGIGRSGTLAVAYAIWLSIIEGEITEKNLLDHIKRLILEGRRQRGPGFVQTKDQLHALWIWSYCALQHKKEIDAVNANY